MTNRRKCFLSVLISFFCIYFSSCANEANTPGDKNNQIDNPIIQVLDAETERQLKQDYWQYIFDDAQRSVFTVDEVWIDYYLGTYNGYVVFVVSSIGICGFSSKHNYNISIGGHDFIFPLNSDIYAWKSGDFYRIATSTSILEYNWRDFLTSNNIRSMYEQYMAYNIIKDDFYMGAFEELDEKIKQQIKYDYWRDFFADWWLTTGIAFSPDNVRIDYYLGTFNGYVIIAVIENTRWAGRIIINGNEFIFPTDIVMYAWKQNEDTESRSFYRILNEDDFFSLPLTHDDADSMYKRYKTYNFSNDKRINPNTFDGLDIETAWHIRFSYNYDRNIIINNPIDYYLGTYNNYAIYVIITPEGVNGGFSIEGFNFSFSGTAPTYAWKKGENFENNQLYRVGNITDEFERIGWDNILTSNDAKNMYKRYLRFFNKGIK